MKASLARVVVVLFIGFTSADARMASRAADWARVLDQSRPVADSALVEVVRLELARARALSTDLARTLDPIVTASWRGFDRGFAMDTVRFMSQYWRLAGNEGFDKSIDRAKARLVAAGFADGKQADRPSLWIEQYMPSGKGWDYAVGTVALVRPGQAEEVLLSKEHQHIALCINSFSTVAGGVTVPLVDVGRGDREEDYANKTVTGAVVIGDADAGGILRRAIAHGAIGVVSTSLPGYLTPDRPGAPATPKETWDILQWGSIGYDEARKPFAFKSTPRAATAMRRALAAGPASVHVTVSSSFSNKPARTLIAEIPGRTLPNERMVIVAHVQEPGAGDNASGTATLTELARALVRNVASKRIPQPERTVTMMLVEEISGSRQWINDHKDLAAGVRYMFSMDMTGEDVRKTGGSFLIERWPDPGAVWERPWDPHSEWGAGRVNPQTLKGDLINDLHAAVCERVAARRGWIVRSNPYEGGSDHTVFGQSGVPSLLNWHFTDRNYHASTDTADKVSGDEMRNVAVAVTTSAWLLASATEAQALAVADLISRAGQARVAVEVREGGALAKVKPDTAAQEATIVATWRKWSGEAVRSVSRLVVGPVKPDFNQKVERLAAGFDVK